MFILSRFSNDIITTFWYSFWLLTWKNPSGVSIPGSSLLCPIPSPSVCQPIYAKKAASKKYWDAMLPTRSQNNTCTTASNETQLKARKVPHLQCKIIRSNLGERSGLFRTFTFTHLMHLIKEPRRLEMKPLEWKDHHYTILNSLK